MALDTEKLVGIALARIDVPGLVSDVLDQVVEPALDALVASTENQLDDVAKAALLPVLKIEVNKKVEELWSGLKPDAPAE